MLGLDGKPKMGTSKGSSRAAKMDFLGLLFHTQDEIKILASFRPDTSETFRCDFPLLLRCSPESDAALPARFCQGRGIWHNTAAGANAGAGGTTLPSAGVLR